MSDLISLQLSPATVELWPAGPAVELILTVENVSANIKDYVVEVAVVGREPAGPPSWVHLPAQPCRIVGLYPRGFKDEKSSEQVPIIIQPPATEMPLGDYQVRFTVSNEKNPTESTSVDLALRIQPALDMQLDPAEQSSMDTGVFKVQVRNLGQAEQVVWLDASDAEGACYYDFAPAPNVKPPTGAAQPARVRLTVRPRTSLQVKEARTHAFTVTARLGNAAGPVLQTCRGRWTQTRPAPPSLQLTLSPRKQHAAKEGCFTLRLNNRGPTALTVQLDASDPKQQCQYTFAAQEVALGGGEQRLVQLTVQPRRERADTKRVNCQFTVKAGTAETPRRPLAEATGSWAPQRIPHWVRWVVVAYVVVASTLLLWVPLIGQLTGWWEVPSGWAQAVVCGPIALAFGLAPVVAIVWVTIWAVIRAIRAIRARPQR